VVVVVPERVVVVVVERVVDVDCPISGPSVDDGRVLSTVW
jgi:hypothetical protein